MVLSVRRLAKSFPGGRALHGVDLDIGAGEVHALIGENGSGKSTLIKCLSGYHEPDAGSEIWLDGRRLELPYPPDQSVRHGFAFVHQDLGLLPTLSVAENVALSHGFPINRLRSIDFKRTYRETLELLARFDDSIDPAAPVASLSKAQATVVALARALRDCAEGGRVLVLDEPTSALPVEEVEALFETIRRVQAQGLAILYVTHHLNEIAQIADRVTVFRDGRVVMNGDAKAYTPKQLAFHMIGEELEEFLPTVTEAARPAPRLTLRGVSGNRVQGIDLEVGAGEIVGVAGLAGSGRSELLRLIYGAQRLVHGEIALEGETLALGGPKDAVERGIVYAPQDRKALGGHMQLSIRENVMLGDVRTHYRRGWINRRAETTEVMSLVVRFQVHPRNPEAKLTTLSGGNQQKVVLARWWRLNPGIILLDEPVNGVDIGAKAEIYRIIADTAAEDGVGVLMVDSDFDDLCTACDRIVVLAGGRIVGEVSGDDRVPSRLLSMIYDHETVGAAA